MATVSPPRPRNLAEAQTKLRHPLDSLRRYIRLYIALEGAALAVLFLAACFWAGLVLDYGPFVAFGFDWVDWLPRAVNLVVLLAGASVLAVLVGGRVGGRLWRESRDAALALVLERRFPKLLGDRLITAVELSDPKAAADLGYSRVMVEETIRDAAARVDQLPVREVFDWGRLIRRGVPVVLLTLGLYGLAPAGSVLAST